ncbi:MAG: peroxidase [Elusimicrobia bacterium]|nr:peroxidase [Elusimicrobiota bacterium]
MLAAFRHDLRKFNLYDTETLASTGQDDLGSVPRRYLFARSPDGAFNDLRNPGMGRAGARFGRNMPLASSMPDMPKMAEPSAREVSQSLMTRKELVPATIVNNLAAAWIQFQVHDWVNHVKETGSPLTVPVKEGDSWHENPMTIDRTAPDSTRPVGSEGAPTYRNTETHWWDASQIYGSSEEKQQQLRLGIDGKLKIRSDGLLPRDPRFSGGIDLTGFNDNYWVGLSMMHTIFVKEHNAICDMLKARHPDWDDNRIFDVARLVNSALLAKIHTVEWTPAILQHPALEMGMKANWWGLLGKGFKNRFGRVSDSEVISGIPGSSTDHHGTDYSLTEEFDIVYLMHPLLRDEYDFYSHRNGRLLGRLTLEEIQGRHTRPLVEHVPMADLFYSFGITNPGAITIRNFPKTLQNFETQAFRKVDLAAVDIMRARERGIPRYNDFRERLRMPRVKSFEELTGGDRELAREISRVYGGNIDNVDAMVGMFAEKPPEGFGFSDTAFRIFILMASRRLKSDRFFTVDYRPEVYTQEGLDWVENNTMVTVMLRHHPELGSALRGVGNAFIPWRPLDTVKR